jgi:CheY-like chemotaxis protein
MSHTNGAEGMNVARAHQPDLVLLDHFMPLMDGLEAIPLIRAGSRSTKIVMLSSITPARLSARALKRGAIASLDMRYDPDELIARLLDA